MKDESFFLAVGLVKPHLPFCAPKKYWDLYDPSQITLPENDYLPEDVTEWSATDWGELRKYDNIPAEGPLPEAQARHLIHGYYACVSYIDEQIGKLIDRVKVLGLWENTAIVLWGDHGWKLGEHGLWCKHTNFELDTHSPLIVRVPGQASVGKPSDSLVEFVDIYPTLTEAAGHKQPALTGTATANLLETSQSQQRPCSPAHQKRNSLSFILYYNACRNILLFDGITFNFLDRFPSMVNNNYNDYLVC